MFFWIADIFLLLSYILLGKKKFLSGWITSVCGNVLFVIDGFQHHRAAIWSMGIIFTCLGIWNLTKLNRDAKTGF